MCKRQCAIQMTWEAAQCYFLGFAPNYSPKHLTSLGYLYFILILVSLSFSSSNCAGTSKARLFLLLRPFLASRSHEPFGHPAWKLGVLQNYSLPQFPQKYYCVFHLMRWPIESGEWRSGWLLLLSRPGCGVRTEMLSFAVLSRLETAPSLFPREIIMNSRSFFCLNGEEK